MNRSRARVTMRTTAQIVREYRGPALFSFGFRPFFLLAGIFSALAVPLWIAALVSGGTFAGTATRDWHVHEMLFGYAPAVAVGYLMIAGANWTGHYPVAGRPLMLLTGLWFAGRAAILVAGMDNLVAASLDAAFLPVFAGTLWREQIAARNGRNLVPCIVVTLLGAANIGFHLRGLHPMAGAASERAAIAAIMLLIATMGGRLVPSFTRNWIAHHKGGSEPAPYDRLDAGAAILTALSLAAWLVLPTEPLTGVLLGLSGLGLLFRLCRWRGWAAWREPLVWVLHLGYLWLGCGLLLLGFAICAPQMIPFSSAIHALTSGAIGVMTLAMMTRTTLSHTGRPRRVGRATVSIYLLVNAAALLRVLAPMLGNAQFYILAVSAALWSSAFGLFVLVYGPMLAAHRAASVGRKGEAK